MRNKKRYVVFTMVLLLVISISFACRYLMIQEYSQIMDKNETQLSDYAGSTWYSEQTGCLMEESENKGEWSVLMEYKGVRSWQPLYRVKDKWELHLYDYSDATATNEELAQGVQKIQLSISISEKKDKTVLRMYNISDIRSDKKETQASNVFEGKKEIEFQKVPNQNLYEYADSVWQNKELGYRVEVQGDEAYCILQYQGNQERYFLGDLPDELWKSLEYAESTESEECATPEIDFKALILESDGEMIMTWSDFAITGRKKQEDTEKLRTLFQQYDKIVFQRVK